MKFEIACVKFKAPAHCKELNLTRHFECDEDEQKITQPESELGDLSLDGSRINRSLPDAGW
jgi:hypothetical protein